MYKFSILALVTLTAIVTAASPAAFMRFGPGAGPISAAAAATGALTSEAAAAKPETPAPPAGIPQACVDALATQKVIVTKPVGHNGIRLDGVAPACMDIARSVLNGRTDIDGPPPTSIDTDSIQYDDLSDVDYEFLSGIFDEWAASQNSLMKRHLESTGDM